MTLKFEHIVLLLTLGLADPPLNAKTLYWIGSNPGDRWSNPNNWFFWNGSESENAIPENGDTLSFEFADLTLENRAISNNDLSDLTVSSIRFGFDDLEIETYVVFGNPLRVSGNIDVNYPETTAEIRCDLTLLDGAAFRAAADRGFGYPAQLLVRGAIALEGTGDLILQTHYAGKIELAGPISGNASIRLPSYAPDVGYPALPVKLSGSEGNTFVGSILMSDNRALDLDKESGVAVTGPLVIGSNSEVSLKRSHQIADTTKVAITSGGRLRLEGHTETIRSLCLTNIGTDSLPTVVSTDGSTLSVLEEITSLNDSPNVTPTLGGKLGLPAGNHLIHTTGSQNLALNIQALVLGEGGFTKTGASGLILGGDSSFGGDAVLQEGEVRVTHSNALGHPSGATILDGGELSLVGAAIGTETLWVNRPTPGIGPLPHALLAVLDSSWAGAVILNTNLLVQGGPMTFSGEVSGPGDLYLFGFTNRLTGSAANTYTGTTTVHCDLLELAKPPGVTAFRGRLIVGTRSPSFRREVRWLQNYQCAGADVTLFFDGLINLNGHREDLGPITFNGGEIATGIGELGVYGLVTVNPESSIARITGRLGLPPGAHEFRVGDGAAFPDLRIEAHVFGGGSLRKTGPGQMWLMASNSYEGLTTVAEGVLSVLNPYGLGASGAGTTVDDGTTLELNFSAATMPELLALRGTGPTGNGALGVFGDVTLRSPFPSIFPAIDLTAETTIAVALNSRLTVDGIISGIGPLTKAGPGTLVLANINPNTYSGDTFVAEGVLNLAKPNFAISVPGNLIVGPAPFNSSAIARWSTSGGMNPQAIATFNAGSLLDLNGNGLTLARLNLNDGADAQTGAGALTFGLGGMVAVGSLNQLGSHAGSSLSGNIGLPANATLTFAVGAYAPSPPFDFNPELNVSANMAAPSENPNFERAGINKSGPGTLRLSGTSSFNGRTDVTEGTLLAASSLAFGSSFDGTVVLNNARLALENSLNIENEVLALNSTATPALENLSGDSFWSGPVIMNRDSAVGVRESSALQLAGVISGAAHFTKVGPGTLRFGGGAHNTYSGVTFVNEGVLLMSKPDGITAVPSTLFIGTPAGLPAMAANLTSYQVLGNIGVNRGGLLNLNGQVENVFNLVLNEGGDVQTTTGVLFLLAGGSIQVFPGLVSDGSAIAGNLQIDAGSHNIIVAAGPGLMGAPGLDISAVIASSGGSITLRKIDSGKLRLSAVNTYAGSARVDAGILQMDGSQSAAVVVGGGGRLMGTGRAGPVTFTGSSGVVAPGRSPGILQVGHFNTDAAGGTLELELNGPVAGTDYDRLSVRGLADLTGMNLGALMNFTALQGQEFTIIGNDGFDAITGEFAGLPEGAELRLGDQIFQITYLGGDGNDVVLTKTGDVYRPVLTIQRISPVSVRLGWPTNDPAFTLQFTTNLNSVSPGNDWVFVTETPTVSGTNVIVMQNTTGPRKFYRLFKP